MLHSAMSLHSIDLRGRLGPSSYPSTFSLLSSPLKNKTTKQKGTTERYYHQIFVIISYEKMQNIHTVFEWNILLNYVNIFYCTVNNVIQRANVKSQHIQLFGQIFILFSSISLIFQYSSYFWYHIRYNLVKIFIIVKKTVSISIPLSATEADASGNTEL